VFVHAIVFEENFAGIAMILAIGKGIRCAQITGGFGTPPVLKRQ